MTVAVAHSGGHSRSSAFYTLVAYAVLVHLIYGLLRPGTPEEPGAAGAGGRGSDLFAPMAGASAISSSRQLRP